jgi:hypothetical protein
MNSVREVSNTVYNTTANRKFFGCTSGLLLAKEFLLFVLCSTHDTKLKTELK